MADLTDIPIREGEDGSLQLTVLRSYLKDASATTYTDSLLIDLLVDKGAVDIWRDLVGVNPESVPYSYDQSYLGLPINRVRLLTSDTDRLSIKHTDDEILNYLEVIPLRYVVSCINLKDSTNTTEFTDTNHPLSILRNYLKSDTIEELNDTNLINLLLDSGMNPFGIVLDYVGRLTSTSLANTASDSGNNLATLDGISFSDPTNEYVLAEKGLDAIKLHANRSVYCKESFYGIYECGENITGINLESKWYAI